MFPTRVIRVLAGVFGFWGVAGGALAAHAVKDPHAAAIVRMGANYALVHGILLLCWEAEDKIARAAMACFTAGTLFFSGSLALKYGLGITAAGVFAPVGGTLLMLGWLTVIARSLRKAVSR